MSAWMGCEGTGRFLHGLEEGRLLGKHGFPRGSEPDASDAHEPAITPAAGLEASASPSPMRPARNASRPAATARRNA
jgi:hypothetical protein